MIFDSRDLALLKTAGACQWLPFEGLQSFQRTGPLRQEVELLARLGYVTLARSRQYFSLAAPGYELLARRGFSFAPGSKRPYAGSPTLRRRLECGRILLTCLAAGIDTTAGRVDDLGRQNVFLPAFTLRGGEGNLMNSACCAGFGHWADTAYMLYFVGRQSPGLYLSNELRHLHNLASVFDRSLRTPSALILAGESYAALYAQLQDHTPSPRHGRQGFVDFWAAYERVGLPVHLLACGDAGVIQLSVMRQSCYRARLARAAFGARWAEHDADIADADGHVGGRPLVIAVDMDLARLRRVCKSARALGRREVMVAALEEQMAGLLLDILPRDRSVRPLKIGPALLKSAFDGGILPPPPAPGQAGETGGFLYA